MPLYLAKAAPRFEVFDQRGEEVRFVGVTVKREPLTLDDYEIVQPGQTVVRPLDITNLYRFKNHVSGDFVLQLPGGYYDPQKEKSFERPTVKESFYLDTTLSAPFRNREFDQLSDIEKVNLPDDGFLISTGGTQSSTALYVVNLDDCVVKLFQGTGKGEPVSSNALPVGTINLKPNESNKLREMVEQILNSRQSFSRFPPQNSSFNLTMTIRTPTGLKYINSYGRPVGKVEEAFDYLLQLVQAN